MPDRKSPPRHRLHAAYPAAPSKGRGKAASAPALRGDSETELTNEELARLVEAVWQHGRVMPEADGAYWRQDACGAWMMREHFGHEDSEFGWKIEKVAVDGRGDALRPFNSANHFDIANRRPHCAITADRSAVPAERQAGPPRNRRP